MNKTTVQISNLVEVETFKNYYEHQSINDLLISIENDGQKTPIIITPQMEIIDGYRRCEAIKGIGLDEIDVFICDVEPIIKERITRNMHRKKTTMDEINDIKSIFTMYPKRQGQRKLENKYSRSEEISRALNNRWTDESSLKKLEHVVNNDFEDYFLSKKIVQNVTGVESCYEFLKETKDIDINNKYGYTEKMIKGEISVTDTNKVIKKRQFLENEFKPTFSIPDKCNSYNIDCVELSKMEEHKDSVDLIFTSPPYFILRKYQNGDPNQLGHEKTKEAYCLRISNIVNGLIPTLKKSANVMINIGETYDDGVGYGIPQLLKDTIEKNTSLKYKDTIIWSKPNPKPQNETVQRTVNNVEYILWFVIDPAFAKFNLISYPVHGKEVKISKGVKDVDNRGIVWDKRVSLTKPYGKIYTHLKEQTVLNIIECSIGKNHEVYKISQEGHPAIMSPLLPVMPILMTTDENDVVFDPFSGSNVVGRMTCLLNRVALSTELSTHYYKIGCKMLENGINDLNEQGLKFISNEVYHNGNGYELPLAA